MKYCKRDKISVKDTDLVCPKCGGPLSAFGVSGGATARPGGPSGATFQLQGEVRRLEGVRAGNVRRARSLAVLSLVAVLSIVFVLWQVYARAVLAYAVLDEIRIVQDPDSDHTIHVSYRVTTPGKVAFDRRSGPRHTEKLDMIARVGPEGFSWSWPSDPKTGIDFNVVYRGGWLLDSESRHFQVVTNTMGEP